MITLLKLLNEAHTLVDEIRRHSEGLDTEILCEAVMLSDEDFGEPADGETLIANLRNEGLLRR